MIEALDEPTVPGIIVFDMEQTITDGNDPPEVHVRPGIPELIDAFRNLGFDVHVWTRARLAHAIDVLDSVGLRPRVDGIHEKPRWEESERISGEDARRILGGVPVLQIDDWPEERIDGVPFLLLEPWAAEGEVVRWTGSEHE
ncbi:MAG: hypothetical protein M3391_09840 [Actinomycetota bacterium]|nr:hypothetical protein [Actinomycetota bacterium]